MKDFLKTLIVSAVTAIAVVTIGFAPIPGLRAQSTRVGGRDVPVTPFEQWFKRLGLLNANAGCDVALEYDSLNTARFTDCTDAAKLGDLRLRGLQVTGVPTTQGGAGSDTMFVKTITAIANNTATDVLTVTVPNASESASIGLTIHGALGAGGAVGANECAATGYGQVIVARTAGVASVETAAAIADTASSCVAGATTMTLAYAVSSNTGANSATQTFTIQLTIARGGGSSTNHVAVVEVTLINLNGSGITIS